MLRYGGPAVVWTLIITILTLMPGKDLPKVDIVNFDKVAHLYVFFALNLLYLRWLCKSNTSTKLKFTITSICVVYGGLIELLQGTFYTDRYSDPIDFAFNTAGCLLALPAYRLLPVWLR